MVREALVNPSEIKSKLDSHSIMCPLTFQSSPPDLEEDWLAPGHCCPADVFLERLLFPQMPLSGTYCQLPRIWEILSFEFYSLYSLLLLLLQSPSPPLQSIFSLVLPEHCDLDPNLDGGIQAARLFVVEVSGDARSQRRANVFTELGWSHSSMPECQSALVMLKPRDESTKAMFMLVCKSV